jgi:NAD(P)-dependent dehydrogenase (short-subunit alcohol dehydrogenase family)
MNVPSPHSPVPVALVTGGSAGLGWVITQQLVQRGYRVVVVGRDQSRLDQAAQDFGTAVLVKKCDVTVATEIAEVVSQLDRLDALINCVGLSDRGLIAELRPERMQQLLDQNVLSALLCCQACLPLLKQSRGTIVNIGSLSSKVGARYLGAYTIAKHALAGLTQQLRLELRPTGVHVALVSPGPIRRQDAGARYTDLVSADLPPSAAAPAGGAKVKGIPPERVAAAVLKCIDRRIPDIVLPGYMRLLITLGHAFPRLGDWLLLRFTS